MTKNTRHYLDMYPLHGPLKPHGLCSPGSLHFWEARTIHQHDSAQTPFIKQYDHMREWCLQQLVRGDFQAYKRTFNKSHMLLNGKRWLSRWKKWKKCKICSLRSSLTYQMTANPSRPVHSWLGLRSRELPDIRFTSLFVSHCKYVGGSA